MGDPGVLSVLDAASELPTLWRQYRTVIAEQDQAVVHILDRYHVMNKFGDKLDKVRAVETRQMKRDGYEPMKEMARTLRNHRELLLNWFRERGEISHGSVAGMNNKAKLAMRRAYGFKSYETIEIACITS